MFVHFSMLLLSLSAVIFLWILLSSASGLYFGWTFLTCVRGRGEALLRADFAMTHPISPVAGGRVIPFRDRRARTPEPPPQEA